MQQRAFRHCGERVTLGGSLHTQHVTLHRGADIRLCDDHARRGRVRHASRKPHLRQSQSASRNARSHRRRCGHAANHAEHRRIRIVRHRRARLILLHIHHVDTRISGRGSIQRHFHIAIVLDKQRAVTVQHRVERMHRHTHGIAVAGDEIVLRAVEDARNRQHRGLIANEQAAQVAAGIHKRRFAGHCEDAISQRHYQSFLPTLSNVPQAGRYGHGRDVPHVWPTRPASDS